MSSAIPLQPHANYHPAARPAVNAAVLSIAGTAIALVCLAALHALSPEFDPSWRMVSEYALGQHKWVLTTMFVTWAIGTWALAYALKNEVATTGGRIGLFFLVLAGIGELMGGLFDVRHSLHGVAALIGMPSLPVAALLISTSLRRNPDWAPVKKGLMLAAHLTWISIALMTIGVMLLFAGFSRAGVDMSSGTAPERLPEGVIAVAGWANRLLILCYGIWVITVASKLKKLWGSAPKQPEAL